MKGQQVIVLGASSQIGLFALPRLVALGAKVWAVSRQTRPPWYPPLPNVSWIRRAGELPDEGRGSHLLFSAGPLHLALEWLVWLSGVGRVVAISTTSVLTKAESADVAERQQVGAIAAAEEQITSACESLAAGWCILRPTLVYGCGMDRNLSLYARFIQRYGFLPLARNARGLRQPIHADDVAEAGVSALNKPGVRGLLAPISGGSTLAYRDMAERIFVALDREPRIVALPPGLLKSGVRLAALFGPYRGLRPQMVGRQAIDLVFDDTPTRQALGVKPREFRPRGEDFMCPTAEFIRLLSGRS